MLIPNLNHRILFKFLDLVVQRKAFLSKVAAAARLIKLKEKIRLTVRSCLILLSEEEAETTLRQYVEQKEDVAAAVKTRHCKVVWNALEQAFPVRMAGVMKKCMLHDPKSFKQRVEDEHLRGYLRDQFVDILRPELASRGSEGSHVDADIDELAQAVSIFFATT